MFRKSPFFIKLFNWEYWPMEVAYFPVFFYVAWLFLKARSFGFWAAADPGIEYGGMRGESKIKILDKLDDKWKPSTVLVKAGASSSTIKEKMIAHDLSFPLFVKPDVGERGTLVDKIGSMQALLRYAKKMPVDFLLQAYVPFKEEYAILHYRHPKTNHSEVTSVTIKKFMSVTGDGISSVLQLMQKNSRFSLQIEAVRKQNPAMLSYVPKEKEEISIGAVGNHCKGTEFINGEYLINDQLLAVFDEIEQSLEGIYYARYDLRCTSDEDLLAGKNIKIVEINGVGAEAAHIYDKNLSLRKRYYAMFRHWRIIYDIAKYNHRQGVKYMSLREIWKWYNDLKAHYALIKDIR